MNDCNLKKKGQILRKTQTTEIDLSGNRQS